LDGVEEITIEDGWLLPGEDLAFKDDLPNVEPVAQKMGERAPRERDPPDGLAALERSHLGDDPPLAEVCHQPVEAAQLEIAAEDGPNPTTMILRSLVSYPSGAMHKNVLIISALKQSRCPTNASPTIGRN
jgi:hypothetical protein